MILPAGEAPTGRIFTRETPATRVRCAGKGLQLPGSLLRPADVPDGNRALRRSPSHELPGVRNSIERRQLRQAETVSGPPKARVLPSGEKATDFTLGMVAKRVSRPAPSRSERGSAQAWGNAPAPLAGTCPGWRSLSVVRPLWGSNPIDVSAVRRYRPTE